MKALLALLFACVFLSSVLVDKAYYALPKKELRRRSRGGKDARAAKIYKMAALGGSLKLFLWLVGGLSAAGLILLAASFAGWLAAVVILVIIWLLTMYKPVNYDESFAWTLVAFLAPAITKVVGWLQPVLTRLAGWIKNLQPVRLHTGLYEKEDLLELVSAQSKQLNNRIPAADLNVVTGALTFGDKTVSSIMTPRREIKLVTVSDPIGPLLMDELHASGFSRFPVVRELTKSANPKIVGILYLKDLVDHADKGKVRDLMKKEVYFINETQTLREALAAFLKTQHHLLIAVNNFEEIVGVISMEDIVEQILGEKITDEFDHYDDLRAVAGKEAQKEHSQHTQAKVE